MAGHGYSVAGSDTDAAKAAAPRREAGALDARGFLHIGELSRIAGFPHRQEQQVPGDLSAKAFRLGLSGTGIVSTHQEGYYGFMKRATITETKNGLSRLLDEVRRGETILIMERKVPVARIEPVRGSPGMKDDRLAVLIGERIISPPERTLDVSALRAEPLPLLLRADSAVRALLADREDSP